jgi:hypothetical protein
MLKRYVMRLGLEEDTSAQIETLYDEVQEDMRTGRLSVAERRERANEFYEQVMELLGEEQKAKLMKLLGADAKRSADPFDRPKVPRPARDRGEGADIDEEVQEDYEEPGYDEEQEHEEQEEEEVEEGYES